MKWTNAESELLERYNKSVDDKERNELMKVLYPQLQNLAHYWSIKFSVEEDVILYDILKNLHRLNAGVKSNYFHYINRVGKTAAMHETRKRKRAPVFSSVFENNEQEQKMVTTDEWHKYELFLSFKIPPTAKIRMGGETYNRMVSNAEIIKDLLFRIVKEFPPEKITTKVVLKYLREQTSLSREQIRKLLQYFHYRIEKVKDEHEE